MTTETPANWFSQEHFNGNHMTTETPANWYFSFRHGQEHFNKYVKIHGTRDEAREEMFRRFGRAWSMQYPEAKALEAIADWGWTELV